MPLALQQDTNLYLGNRYMIKAGFGSYSTPYLHAIASLGDGRRTLLNIDGSYIKSTGNISGQDYSNMAISASGSYFSKGHEFYGTVRLRANNYHLYGYDHKLYEIDKEDIRQQFNDFSFIAGLKNTSANKLRISYNPVVSGSYYSNLGKASETTVGIRLPAEKLIGETFLVKAEVYADLTKYNTIDVLPNNFNVSNNVVQINPSVQFAKQRFKVHAGFSPVWNNGNLQWLPDLYVEAQIKEKIFMFQAGWVGKVIKNTYRNLTGINPYVERIFSQNNTKQIEFYGGLKGTVGKHFNLNAKASWISYDNFPLFINDMSERRK